MTFTISPDWSLLLWGILFGYLITGTLSVVAGAAGWERERTYGLTAVVVGLFYIAWFFVVVFL